MTVKTFVIGELCVSPYNVRTDGRAIGALDALKSSILTRGLLMPLVVHPMVGNPKKFGAIAGGRRYRALKALIGEGKIPASFPIDAVVREGMNEAELIELSTAENIVRRDLYPYETYAALARARRRGSTFEELADTLGQDVDWVRKGARLGMLPKQIFTAYSEEKLTLECAKAFAATEDEALQLHAFAAFQQTPLHQRNSALVRQLLKVGDRELTRLLLFVGEERYRAEGGHFELDLFADAEDFRGIVSNEGLLRELAQAKLGTLRKRIRTRAGRESLRFAVEPPKNDFDQVDKSLQIHPPEVALELADEICLAELLEDQARILEQVRELIDIDGKPLPHTEDALAAFDERDAGLDTAIAAIEDKRPIVLPAGDVIATIDIDDRGDVDVRYWWATRKAQAAAEAPKAKPALPPRAKPATAKGPVADLKPVADGAAIVRGNNDDWTARERADRIVKDGFGLTQEGVLSLRSLRRAMLRSLLLQDHADGGQVARDYFTWAQLRMQLTQGGSDAIGMRRIVPLGAVDLREDKAGEELIAESTMGVFEESLERVKKWKCFALPDLQLAFRNYLVLDEDMKAEASALLACLVLERSLEADGYRIRLHDVVAAETGMGNDEIRAIGAFTPSPRFFGLFDANHRLELAIPFVGRETVASWSKKKSPEQTKLVAQVFTGDSAETLSTDLHANAERWVHHLLAFVPADDLDAAPAAALEEASA